MSNAIYLEILPKKELTHLVKCFWISSNESGSALYYTTLPDGCFELVVFFQKQVLKSVMLFGILSEAYDMVMPDNETKIGIRFQPLAKEYYLDKCQTLDRFSAFAKSSSDNLLQALQHFSDQVTLDIQEVVTEQSIDRRKQLLFELLHQTSGNMDVNTLSANCYWSARQMNRYLNSQLGISLKSYSNILKCYAAYSDIKAGDLNPDGGYYDQSHFIREIRKHTGTTPKALFNNQAQRYLQFNDPLNSPGQE
jgi:AraC-like DNA-binding protein